MKKVRKQGEENTIRGKEETRKGINVTTEEMGGEGKKGQELKETRQGNEEGRRRKDNEEKEENRRL